MSAAQKSAADTLKWAIEESNLARICLLVSSCMQKTLTETPNQVPLVQSIMPARCFAVSRYTLKYNTLAYNF